MGGDAFGSARRLRVAPARRRRPKSFTVKGKFEGEHYRGIRVKLTRFDTIRKAPKIKGFDVSVLKCQTKSLK
jgi:hypothetical protein